MVYINVFTATIAMLLELCLSYFDRNLLACKSYLSRIMTREVLWWTPFFHFLFSSFLSITFHFVPLFSYSFHSFRSIPYLIHSIPFLSFQFYFIVFLSIPFSFIPVRSNSFRSFHYLHFTFQSILSYIVSFGPHNVDSSNNEKQNANISLLVGTLCIDGGR